MKRKRGNTQDGMFNDSMIKNTVYYQYYYDRLKELSISMFEWENIPDSVDPRFLELFLFEDGKMIFFEDEVMGHLALRCVTGGNFDVYNIPLERRAYAVNGYQKELQRDNSVIIYNNLIHTTSHYVIDMYAQLLAELEATIRVNGKAQKTPILLSCDESQRLTLKNLYMKYEGNEPFIFGDKQLRSDTIKAIHTDAPYVADKLYGLKTQIWNEALTYLGISNVNTVKKERMITDEVIRNMGGTIASRYSRLQARRNAADEINRMFGLDVKVNYRADYRELDDEMMLSGETEDGLISPVVQDTRTRTSVEPEMLRGYEVK